MRLSYLISSALLAALAVLSLTVLYQLGLRLGASGGPATAAVAPAAARPGDDPAARTFRRCEHCTLRWRSAERDRASGTRLRAARAWRRTRRLVTGTSSARLPASWDRCPRCLSREVRASRASVRSQPPAVSP